MSGVQGNLLHPMINGKQYKTCSTCRIVKAATTEFFSKGTSKFGLQGKCKDCFRAYASEHHDSIARAKLKWRENNPALDKAAKAEYYARNRQRAIDRATAWRIGHPEREAAKGAVWRANNREMVNAKDRRRYALERVAGRLTTNEWLEILERFEHRCVYCGSAGKMTIEHIIPIARGGLTTPENIVPACASCNYSKQHKLLEEWVA